MKYIYRHNGKLRKGTPPEGAEVLFVCVGKRVISASKFANIRSKKHDKMMGGK